MYLAHIKMEAIVFTYNRRLIVQFDQMISEGEIIIKDDKDTVIMKQKIINKNFVMIELKEETKRFSVEVIDKAGKRNVITNIG